MFAVYNLKKKKIINLIFKRKIFSTYIYTKYLLFLFCSLTTQVGFFGSKMFLQKYPFN